MVRLTTTKLDKGYIIRAKTDIRKFFKLIKLSGKYWECRWNDGTKAEYGLEDIEWALSEDGNYTLIIPKNVIAKKWLLSR